MALDIREIKQFLKIGGAFRSPNATEDGKRPVWNNTDGFFDYTEDNILKTAVRETATNRAEFTLNDGTKVYLTLGALAWLNSVSETITSVFGRTGAVVAASGDYTASQVTNAFDKTVDTLDSLLTGTTNVPFTAVNRTQLGSVVAALHSHTNKVVLDQITSAGGGIIPSSAQIAAWDGWTGLTTEQIQDVVAAMIQDITGLTWTYSDTAGTLTPTMTLENFTTDNLAEGTTNKYGSQNTIKSFLVSLPTAGTIQDRIDAAVEGTDYPTGWVLSATGDTGKNLEMVHTVNDSTITSIAVKSEDVGGKRMLVPFRDAYSGILEDGYTITIEGLCPTDLPLDIKLIFS